MHPVLMFYIEMFDHEQQNNVIRHLVNISGAPCTCVCVQGKQTRFTYESATSRTLWRLVAASTRTTCVLYSCRCRPNGISAVRSRFTVVSSASSRLTTSSLDNSDSVTSPSTSHVVLVTWCYRTVMLTD